MKEFRTALVGCGGIANVHARVLKELEYVTPVAFADIKHERALALSELCGGRAYTSLEDMLEAESFDVLHICTPHALHTSMAKLAADKGINIFCEKPPAINAGQWREFCELSQKTRLGVCFQNRYNESVRWLESLLESGKCGKILGAKAFVTWHRDSKYYTESGWRGAIATEGGGVLINQSVHTLDLLVRFLGRPKKVEASMSNYHLKGVIEVEDTMQAYLDFGDKTALFYATTAHVCDSPVLLELVCENGTFRMEEREISCKWNDGRKETVSFPDPASQVGKSYWGSGHGACIKDFYEHILSSEPFMNSPEGVNDTVETMLALYDSARNSKVCEL